MRLLRTAAFPVLVCLAAPVNSTSAQSGLEIEPTVGVHQVTIVNQMGYKIRLKVMGFRHDAHFVADLPNEGSSTQQFYGGERVVCVWNPERRLTVAAMVHFDKPGTLVLRPAVYATRSAAPAGGESPLPMLSY